MWMKIKKLTEDAIIPTRAYSSDAGLDVYSTEDVKISEGEDHLFRLGWSCAIPEGWVLIVKEKSGRAVKDKLDVGACVIDSGYRGEVHVHLFNNALITPVHIKKGEKIAQMILVPCWTGQPEEVETLDDTPRGSGGFGSTGI